MASPQALEKRSKQVALRVPVPVVPVVPVVPNTISTCDTTFINYLIN